MRRVCDLKSKDQLCLSRQKLFVFQHFLFRFHFRLNKLYLCSALFVDWLDFDLVDSHLIDLNSIDSRLIDQSSIDQSSIDQNSINLNWTDLWSFDSSLNDSNSIYLVETFFSIFLLTSSNNLLRSVFSNVIISK
jgi:hypothetical protein